VGYIRYLFDDDVIERPVEKTQWAPPRADVQA
jgi:hypothetical protein